MKICSKHEQAYEDSCPWCEPAEYPVLPTTEELALEVARVAPFGGAVPWGWASGRGKDWNALLKRIYSDGMDVSLPGAADDEPAPCPDCVAGTCPDAVDEDSDDDEYEAGPPPCEVGDVVRAVCLCCRDLPGRQSMVVTDVDLDGGVSARNPEGGEWSWGFVDVELVS